MVAKNIVPEGTLIKLQTRSLFGEAALSSSTVGNELELHQ